jgi:hypothetical protein
MKTYEVELRRTGYIVVTVQAESEDHAEELAWTELACIRPDYADWEIESFKEMGGTA